MDINTSGSLKRASTVLSGRCEKTQREIYRLREKTGADEEACPMVRALIPQVHGSGDDVVFCAVNGAKFYFLRGSTVLMPKNAADVLAEAGELGPVLEVLPAPKRTKDEGAEMPTADRPETDGTERVHRKPGRPPRV